MEEHVKKVLNDQLDVIAERSKKCGLDYDGTLKLTQAMVSVAQALTCWTLPEAREVKLEIEHEKVASAIGAAIHDNPQEGQALHQTR
jgi:hypothetical protein